MNYFRPFSVISLAFAAALFCGPTPAQLFGSKNYEECMLEKMKGQAANMAQIASAACLKQFPREILFTKKEVSATWCDTSFDSISACAVVNPDYKIIRAEAVFTHAKCGSPESNMSFPDAEASANPPIFGATFKFSVPNAFNYECANFKFFGHKKM